MSGFDEYVKRLTDGLDLPESAKEQIRQEAVAHLEDEARRLLGDGKTREQAEAAAMESFGRDDAMAAQISEALAAKQRRWREVKGLKVTAAVAALALFTVALGTGFGAVYRDLSVLLADLLSSSGPGRIWVYLVTVDVTLMAAAAVIAWKMSGTGKRVAAQAALGVFGVYILSKAATSLIPTSVYVRMSNESTAGGWGAFSALCVSLVLYLLVPLGTAAWGFFLKRDRVQVRLFVGCLAIAAVITAFGSVELLLRQTNWEAVAYWTNCLAWGFSLLHRVMLVWFLARAMAARQQPAADGRDGQQPQLAS